MEQIYSFAVKWRDKFLDENTNYVELVETKLSDDCATLGFEMDCGKAFSEKYGKALNNYEDLDRVIKDITDVYLLGSAVYSQWRYFNHWAYTGTEISEPENRSWFVLVLDRIAVLTKPN